MIHIVATFTILVRQHQLIFDKGRVVDYLLADDSASCRFVAKYCHRCGHRHLSERPSHFLRRPWSASAAHKAPKRVRFGRKL